MTLLLYHCGFIIWELIDFVTSSKELQRIFEYSHLRNYKEYSKSQWLSQVLLSTIFYKKYGTFNETFLTWSSLTCNIFLKNSWFLCSDKSHIRKNYDVIACFFCPIKEQKFKSSQTHNSFTRYELNHRFFWRIVLEISRTLFSQNTFQWLLLEIIL